MKKIFLLVLLFSHAAFGQRMYGKIASQAWVNKRIDSLAAVKQDTGKISIGPKGDKGEIGPQGIQGITGATGAQGFTGTTGAKGDKGDPGIQGPIGATGPMGSTGLTGSVGATGSNGPPGATGPQGLKGDKGDTGSQGIQGITGAPGLQGLKGDKGDLGPQGIQGFAGVTGPQGLQGLTGAAGASAPNPTPDTLSAGRAFNTAYLMSATKYVDVIPSVKIACALSLTTGQEGTVALQTSPNATTWTTVATVSNSNTGTLTIGLNTIQASSSILFANVPPNYYWRLLTTNVTGTPTFTMNVGNKKTY